MPGPSLFGTHSATSPLHRHAANRRRDRHAPNLPAAPLSPEAETGPDGRSALEHIPPHAISLRAEKRAMWCQGAKDVTASFRETTPGKLVGLVSGLVNGDNRLTVKRPLLLLRRGQ